MGSGASWIDTSCAKSLGRPSQVAECKECADDEDRRRQVDEAEVAECVEAPGIVRRQSDGQCEDWRRHRADPGPDVSPADAEPAEEHDREAGRGDEPR